MSWSIGDHVEYTSTNSPHVFRGVIEGFFGKDRQMALCTDQSERGSRPVGVHRLRRPSMPQWGTGMVA